MCEYINDAIIQEDFSMEKYIFDEDNGLWYELQGDYYIPCLAESVQVKGPSAFGGNGTFDISGNIVQHYTQSC